MASSYGLQQLIGAALLDDRIWATLRAQPLTLADRFGLTIAERRFLVTASAPDLAHFALLVESWSTGVAPTRQHRSDPLARARRVS